MTGRPPAAGTFSATLRQAPFLRAPEASGTIFTVLLLAACAPLAAGVFFYGWRALQVAAISILTCVATETAYYRITRLPALLGRSHAALTGLLLALTLPPFVPWFVPVAGGVFAILVGKALFGGVGHFLWQPALVGRLAVAALFAPPSFLADARRPIHPVEWPVLSPATVVVGDIRQAAVPEHYRQWRTAQGVGAAEAVLRPRPQDQLRRLGSSSREPAADSIATVLRTMPPAWDLMVGAYGTGIGEGCSILVIVAGLYLVYRNYVRGHLPGMFLLGAALTAALAPVHTADGWRWAPLLGPMLPPEGAVAGLLSRAGVALVDEGVDVGFVFVAYQLLAGELMLAAWFLAPEMTSRPVTAPAQAIFGLVAGILTILLRMYIYFPLPAYAAVLICNTLTPALDALVRPRVFGGGRLAWLRRRAGRGNG